MYPVPGGLRGGGQTPGRFQRSQPGGSPPEEVRAFIVRLQALASGQGPAPSVSQMPTTQPTEDEAGMWERVEKGIPLLAVEYQGITHAPTHQVPQGPRQGDADPGAPMATQMIYRGRIPASGQKDHKKVGRDRAKTYEQRVKRK